MGGSMADFNKAFDKIFLCNGLSWYGEINNHVPIQNNDSQPSTECWSNMRKLGFSNKEILAYIKFFWCQGVWNEIDGVGVNSQPLAESMLSFALTNGADHCLYLLNSTLKLKGGQGLLKDIIEKVNQINGDEILLKFGMAKIIYYDLSDRYLSHEGKAYIGTNS